MKGKTIARTFVIVLALLIVSNLAASNGTQIGTVGARATAMGSCFRGLANDPSAMFFNPAGIVNLDGKWIIGTSIGLIAPRGSYTAYQYPAAAVPFTGMYTDERTAKERNFYVPALNIIYKASEKMAFGLGVYAPFGLGTEFDLLHVPEGYGNANAISKEYEHYSDHMVIQIQPTISYKVSDKLSVGIGFDYIWGKMVLDQVSTVYHPLLAPDYATLLTALGGLTADQMRMIVETNLDSEGSSYGANFGILYKMNDKLSIGLSGRWHKDLALSGDLKQTIAFPGDPQKIATLNAMVQNGLLDATTAQTVAALFSGQNAVTTVTGNADLPLPWTAGIGIAYKVCPKLTITSDVSMTNWSSWDVITVEVENGTDIEMKEDWQNTIEAGFGFEYLAKDNGSNQFFIRGGFYTTDTPVPTATMTPTILDPNRRYVVTGGLGLNMGKIAFNLAAEYVIFQDNDIPASDYVFDANGMAENYAGLYKFNALVITFGTSISL